SACGALGSVGAAAVGCPRVLLGWRPAVQTTPVRQATANQAMPPAMTTVFQQMCARSRVGVDMTVFLHTGSQQNLLGITANAIVSLVENGARSKECRISELSTSTYRVEGWRALLNQ